MGKILVNECLPDFVYETPFEKGLAISEFVKGQKKTVILFLRYYGCTLCQYDMNQLAAHYEKITEKGAKVLVVLQSDYNRMQEVLGNSYRQRMHFHLISFAIQNRSCIINWRFSRLSPWQR